MTQTLPLFYKNPQPITVESHSQLGVDIRKNYAFAKNTNSIPLVTGEFALASQVYPIVFVTGEVKAALAITGFRDNENVFVNDKGEWRKDTYVPGYVGRYPFIFFEDEANDQLILCIDADSDLVKKNGEVPLFKDGKPSDFAESALKTATEYQSYLNATREFVTAIEEAGLLVENQAELTAPDGQNLRLTGFYIIDEGKFKQLPDSTIVDWHQKGWLYLVYAHFISMANWQKVAQFTTSLPNTAPSETIH